MTTIQVRIDEKTKQSARRVFEEIGLDMSAGIMVYLKQVALHRRMPFALVTQNGFTVAEESSILGAAEEAYRGKNITKAMDTKAALAYLKKL